MSFGNADDWVDKLSAAVLPGGKPGCDSDPFVIVITQPVYLGYEGLRLSAGMIGASTRCVACILLICSDTMSISFTMAMTPVLACKQNARRMYSV